MSILDKLRVKQQPDSNQPETVEYIKSGDKNDLNFDEITFLLTSLKDLTFTVGDVELVYNTIIKLQNQFLQLKENQNQKK
jgi:hypothetical protein